MKTGNKPRLLIAVTCIFGGGFLRVAREMIAGLAGRFDVRALAVCTDRERTGFGPETRVERLDCRSIGDVSIEALQSSVRRNRPDVILLYCPPDTASHYLDGVAGLGVPVVSYVPVEGRIREPIGVAALRRVDACVQFTEFARFELIRHGIRNDGDPHTLAIPHGVNAGMFHPLEGGANGAGSTSARRRARDLIFPDRPELRDAFIVLNANRPYPRKRLDLTFRGFAEFARDKPANVRLCLHQPDSNRIQRRIIRRMVEAEGIADRVIYSPPGYLSVFSDEDLNKLYNACDVGVNTAGGEGWGLISFEHAATGAAQILPDHTVFPEQWAGAAELVPVAEVDSSRPEYDLPAVAPARLADILERLYSDRDYLSERSHAARNRALDPRFQWGSVMRQWESALAAAAGL